MGRLSRTKKNVEIILNEFELARSKDNLLIALYMDKFHGAVNIYDIVNANSVEGITRARRKIQEEGRCLPPAIILFERELKQQEYIDEFANKNKEVL